VPIRVPEEVETMSRHPWSLFLTAAAVLAAAPSPLLAQSATAKIRIDPDRVVDEVNPLVFGNFVEHLGRCVYGGVFEEKSPLADADGFRKDVMEGTKGLGVTMLRWPGGNFASGYNWKDGIGPRDQRPARRDHAWGALESNRFGTDEFLTYCEKLKVEPYLCINAGLGSVEEARNWVDYTNESANTYWAQQRRKNGRDKPWGVKYWGLGNEIDGPWQLGHKNAEDYAKFALEAAKAMRRSDGSIKLIASGSSNFGPGVDWVGWNRAVLERLRNEIDYISLHTYVGNRTNNFEEFLAFGRDLDDRIEVVKGQIRAVRVGNPDARPINIAFDEWNVWYRTRRRREERVKPGWPVAPPILDEVYTMEDALAFGGACIALLNHADRVKAACLAQLVNVIAPIMTETGGPAWRQTIFHPFAHMSQLGRGRVLRAEIDAPTYAARYFDPRGDQDLHFPLPAVPYLKLAAVHDEAGAFLTLFALNRHLADAMPLEVQLRALPASSVDVALTMHDSDLKAVNTKYDPDRIKPLPLSGVTIESDRLIASLPPASWNVIRVKISN
jgi:alpha-L-arabinofuranosidase